MSAIHQYLFHKTSLLHNHIIDGCVRQIVDIEFRTNSCARGHYVSKEIFHQYHYGIRLALLPKFINSVKCNNFSNLPKQIPAKNPALQYFNTTNCELNK